MAVRSKVDGRPLAHFTDFQVSHVFIKNCGVLADNKHTSSFQNQKIKHLFAARVSGSCFCYVLKTIHACFHFIFLKLVAKGSLLNITILSTRSHDAKSNPIDSLIIGNYDPLTRRFDQLAGAI